MLIFWLSNESKLSGGVIGVSWGANTIRGGVYLALETSLTLKKDMIGRERVG
jgi:hypothetical protein